jgi:hypothetical protein
VAEGEDREFDPEAVTDGRVHGGFPGPVGCSLSG